MNFQHGSSRARGGGSICLMYQHPNDEVIFRGKNLSLLILDNDEIIVKRDNLACARPSDGHLRSWPVAVSGEGVGTRNEGGSCTIYP